MEGVGCHLGEVPLGCWRFCHPHKRHWSAYPAPLILVAMSADAVEAGEPLIEGGKTSAAVQEAALGGTGIAQPAAVGSQLPGATADADALVGAGRVR